MAEGGHVHKWAFVMLSPFIERVAYSTWVCRCGDIETVKHIFKAQP